MHDNSDGLICARLLDGEGGAAALDWEGISGWQPAQGPLWVHLDYTADASRAWLRAHERIDDFVADALLTRETRPRSAAHGQELLLSLRGINTNPGQEEEEMVAIRAWSDGQLLVTTRHRRVRAVDQVRRQLDEHRGPRSIGEFLHALPDQLQQRVEEAISGLEDRVDELEENALLDAGAAMRQRLLQLRREVILLRRYLAPQRDALNRLWQERLPWLGDDHRLNLREVADSVIRQVEDLDALRDRSSVLNEELSSRMAEQMNSRMYVLSLVAGVFLPLGFVTGLLGVNVGGIPGSASPWAFTVVTLALGLAGLLQWRLFKRRRWV